MRTVQTSQDMYTGHQFYFSSLSATPPCVMQRKPTVPLLCRGVTGHPEFYRVCSDTTPHYSKNQIYVEEI
ncbi:hypothetical protein BDR04DRAFT_1092418 [Suillus decipiens]|nr:hypothetical protein BDR04DRAFT_1092418 [Suillus decipiens]